MTVRSIATSVLLFFVGIGVMWTFLTFRYASADDVPAVGPKYAYMVDGGVDAPVVPPEPPDPVASPQDTINYTRAMWKHGGWQFAVCLAWMLAVFITKRMEPKDRDGDGKPDPDGWRGKTWALAAGALAVLGPLAAVAMNLDGAAMSSVLLGVPVLIAAVMDAVNPKRGIARKAPA